jgi:hypothetical protein
LAAWVGWVVRCVGMGWLPARAPGAPDSTKSALVARAGCVR